MAKTKIDHRYTTEIVCPYCGWKDSDSWEHESDRHTCGACDCEFAVETRTERFYDTFKLALCRECGQQIEVREGPTGAETFAIHSTVKDGGFVRCDGSRKGVE